MIELLLAANLAAILAAIWTLRRKRDWYVVEWRMCNAASLNGIAFDDEPEALDKVGLKTYGLSVDKAKRSNSVLLNHRNGGQIFISQDVFEDLGAAQLLFDWVVSRFPNHTSFCSVAYLRRLRATSPGKAMLLPPDVGIDRNPRTLRRSPAEHWYEPPAEDD